MTGEARAPIVVIGGGTAGCTVVSTLAGRTASDIVLVEPGPVSTMDDVPSFLEVLAHDEMVNSRDVTVVRGRPRQTYREARALGGGSAVNGLILSGEVPPELEGLTRWARDNEVGDLGRALCRVGGEPVRLWWNGGRWNPGRAVAHLVEEGRIQRVVDQVVAIDAGNGRIVVRTTGAEIVASQVVVCAGALATPDVLLASTLGPDVRSIGEGLQTHPMITFTVHRRSPPPTGTAQFEATTVRRGTTSNGRSSLMVAYEGASHRDRHLGLVSVMVLDVESRGIVGRGDGGPDVDFNCLGTPGDIDAMVGAVRALIEVTSSPAIADVATTVSVDSRGTPVEVLGALDNSALADWVLDRVEAASHASSSCAAAVDAHGRLRGCPGVWVADASVLPRSPSCTPAGPVTMEARRIARAVGDAVTGTAERDRRTEGN